jgi:membrane-bound acyltransferase YfiQ involved in biofilm formation
MELGRRVDCYVLVILVVCAGVHCFAIGLRLLSGALFVIGEVLTAAYHLYLFSKTFPHVTGVFDTHTSFFFLPFSGVHRAGWRNSFEVNRYRRTLICSMGSQNRK